MTTSIKHSSQAGSANARRTPRSSSHSTSKRRITATAAKTRPATTLLPLDHPSREILEGTHMNFLQLEQAIDAFWTRNVAARVRLGLRPNQDIRTAVKPAKMSKTAFDTLCAEIDDATYGFLEGLGALWGHSIEILGDATDLDRAEPRYVYLDQCKASGKADKPVRA